MTPRWEAEERLRRSAYLPGELQLIKSCIRTSRWTETTRATVRANSVENTTELTNKRESRTGLKRDPAVSVLRLMMVVSLKYWTFSQCFDILTRMRQNVILWYIIIKKGNLNVIKNISSRKQTVNTTLTYLCWFGNEFLIFTSNSYGATIPFIQSFFFWILVQYSNTFSSSFWSLPPPEKTSDTSADRHQPAVKMNPNRKVTGKKTKTMTWRRVYRDLFLSSFKLYIQDLFDPLLMWKYWSVQL